MSYRVKLNVFEGPFDLLVYLIEHAEMSIYDIQISEIVKQYMEHVKAMQITDVNVSSTRASRSSRRSRLERISKPEASNFRFILCRASAVKN